MNELRVEQLKHSAEHDKALSTLEEESLASKEYFMDYSGRNGLIALKGNNPVGLVGYSAREPNCIAHIFVSPDHRKNAAIAKKLV